MAGSVDIITLANLEEKMPRWHPNDASHLHALVDMGSNGIRFSISDLSPPHTRLLKCIYRERAAISLFDALTPETIGDVPALSFPPATIQKVAATLSRFRAIALAHGVPSAQVTVLATEAMRRASNAGAMLDAIAASAPDLTVRVLAPEVEALLGAMGARSGFVDVKGLFLDLGGGSVQMTYIDTTCTAAPGGPNDHGPLAGDDYAVAAATAGESMPFGAARLTRAVHSSESKANAVAQDVERGMLSSFGKMCAKFPALAQAARGGADGTGPGVDIYLCGGGFRGYGSMLMHSNSVQPYPIPLIGSYSVSGESFTQTKRMRKINKEHAGKIFGMSKRRREQFPAIATVIEGLVEAVPRINRVTFCAGGNREGALMMKLPPDLRDSNPVSLLGVSSAGDDGAEEARLVQAVSHLIDSAIPRSVAASKVAPLYLTSLIVRHIWTGRGEDAAANASLALYDAAHGHPSAPGLSHAARALLGLTLCARWGAGVAPCDRELYENMQKVAGGADSEEVFWAGYVGAVAAAIGLVVPARPGSSEEIGRRIRFGVADLAGSGREDGFVLSVQVASEALRGLGLEDVQGCFEGVRKTGGKLGGKGKGKGKEGWRVSVHVQEKRELGGEAGEA